MVETTVSLVSAFILEKLAEHTQNHSGKSVPPLFLGVQGPQGCGKSYLCTLLPSALPNLKIASLSLDDLYLPHLGLEKLAQDNSENKMLQGRGPAGTHDLVIGKSLMESFSKINEEKSNTVQVPIFDKSLFGGQGDRRVETVKYEGPIDVVVLEGWMLGFSPQAGSVTLKERYNAASRSPAEYTKASGLDYSPPFLLEHNLADLEFIEKELMGYKEALWKYLDCFVSLRPKEMGYVWEWRLEQENNMKAKNGGLGMTDAEVKAFIARYMPGYELYLDSIAASTTSWNQNSLKIVVARDRSILSTGSL